MSRHSRTKAGAVFAAWALSLMFAVAYSTASEMKDGSFAKGKAFYDKKQYAEAIPELAAAIEVDPNNFEAYRLRASSYRYLKQFDKAVGDYTRGIELRPKSFACYYGRAMAKRGFKDYAGAIADAEMGVRLAPEKDKSDALLLLGGCKYDNADYAGALDTCRQAEKISPTPEIRNCMARAHRELGQPDQAVKVLDGIIKENDGLSYVYVNRAKSYIALGEPQKALMDYDKAFELKPDMRESRDAKNDLAKIEVLQKSGGAKKTVAAGEKIKRGAELLRYVEYYDKEKTKKSLEYTYYRQNDNEIKHGDWRNYDEKGNITEDGHYKDGKRYGAWTEDSTYTDFERVTIRTVRSYSYTEDGSNYSGVTKEYYDNGQQKSECGIGKVEGSIGPCTTWHKNGQMESRGVNGGKNGRIGLWEHWNDQGQLISKHDHDTGIRTEWTFDNDGKLRSVTNYKKDKYHGLQEYYYETGQIKIRGLYIDGKPDGTSTSWRENGQKQHEDNYSEGKRNGVETWWYKDGTVFRAEHYKDGIRDGTSTVYYENGQKREECIYAGGRELQCSSWNESGKAQK